MGVVTGFVEVRLPVETARAFAEGRHGMQGCSSCDAVKHACEAVLPPELPDEPSCDYYVTYAARSYGHVIVYRERGDVVWWDVARKNWLKWSEICAEALPGSLRVFSPGPVLNGDKT